MNSVYHKKRNILIQAVIIGARKSAGHGEPYLHFRI